MADGSVRFLVGTLHTEENEVEECLDSIRRQRGVDFEQIFIEGLPKREAHERLYGTFMRRASEFDFFIKVDADMVLLSHTLFADVASRFEGHTALGMKIAVWDFFADGLIIGLHAYRSSVRWAARERLFTDVDPVPRSAIVVDRDDLAPAAIHCKDPSPYQCFHYGLHRGVKLSEVLAGTAPEPHRRQGHGRNREATWMRFLESGDVRRGWASLGYELALRGRRRRRGPRLQVRRYASAVVPL